MLQYNLVSYSNSVVRVADNHTIVYKSRHMILPVPQLSSTNGMHQQVSISDLFSGEITNIDVNSCDDDFTDVSVHFHGSISAYVHARHVPTSQY